MLDPVGAALGEEEGVLVLVGVGLAVGLLVVEGALENTVEGTIVGVVVITLADGRKVLGDGAAVGDAVGFKEGATVATG